MHQKTKTINSGYSSGQVCTIERGPVRRQSPHMLHRAVRYEWRLKNSHNWLKQGCNECSKYETSYSPLVDVSASQLLYETFCLALLSLMESESKVVSSWCPVRYGSMCSRYPVGAALYKVENHTSTNERWEQMF